MLQLGVDPDRSLLFGPDVSVVFRFKRLQGKINLPSDLNEFLQGDNGFRPIVSRISKVVGLPFLERFQLRQIKVEAEPVSNVSFVIPVEVGIVIIHVVRLLP